MRAPVHSADASYVAKGRVIGWLGPSSFSNSLFQRTAGSAGEAGRSLTMPRIMRAGLSVLVAPQSNQRIAMCGCNGFSAA